MKFLVRSGQIKDEMDKQGLVLSLGLFDKFPQFGFQLQSVVSIAIQGEIVN